MFMFAVEGYDGGVEEGPQHPHHHQVDRANTEHLEYQNSKILGLRISIDMKARKPGFPLERF